MAISAPPIAANVATRTPAAGVCETAPDLLLLPDAADDEAVAPVPVAVPDAPLGATELVLVLPLICVVPATYCAKLGSE